MAEVREYTVVVNGNETTMQLSDEDAERLGVKEPDSGPEARSAEEEAPAKSRSASNKSRSAENK